MSGNKRPEVFCKKGVLKHFAKFAGKNLCQGLPEDFRWLLLDEDVITLPSSSASQRSVLKRFLILHFDIHYYFRSKTSFGYSFNQLLPAAKEYNANWLYSQPIASYI